ncbi:DnaD domain-containing protein [Amphibacillus sp. Q70]|uniref:DnaD domain-containing protein n=1 Tax=Amphibacillus sp. Q70 TaxID=3453416 RepID=UPI003F86F942
MQELYQTIFSDQMMISKKLFSDYKQLGIDEQELVVILHIHRFIQEEIFFPPPLKIAELMAIDEQKCSQLLRQLIQKDLLTIIELQSENGIVNERYSLEPLWKKLYQDKPTKNPNNQFNDNMMNIFVLFEQEFGRALSPFEIEMINVWLDEEKIEPVLIKAALRETVLMSKLNFRYIDRILREWKRKGIHTVEQARQQTKTFHAQKSNPTQSKTKRDDSVYYNWLEENE